MRKWMRERISRRKKTPQEGKEEAAQAPLQPAYFDGAPPPASSTSVQHSVIGQPHLEPEKAGAEQFVPGHSQSESPKVQGQPVPLESNPQESRSAGERPKTLQPRRPNTESRQGRRRRGRGGRGRNGPPPVRSASEVQTSGAVGISNSGAVEATSSPDHGGLSPQPVSTPGPKGVVVLAIGLPGSGKSSWFKRHNISPLSSDLLRALLFDDPTEQRFQDLVFSNLRSMLKARLIARRPMNYVDATNLTSHDRRGWIKLAKDYGYEVRAVFFDVPLEVCLERNRHRERVVSEDVMRRMASKQKPPTFEEGFAKITVVRVKQKE
jgi:predicted kinase